MRLLGVIRLAHQTIARALNFFVFNVLILAGLLTLGIILFYFALASGFNTVLFLVYPFLALLFYLYAAATQVNYYGPRLRGEESLPALKEAWRGAKKLWPSLALMAVILTALALVFAGLPAGWKFFYFKIYPSKAAAPFTFEELKNLPLSQFTQVRNLFWLTFYLLSFLLVYLLLPLVALGFTATVKEGGFKSNLKNLRTYFKVKPCSSILLYLFGFVIIILLPYRILSLPGPTFIPVVDVIFVGLQFLIALFVFVYGMLMALVSQMILQEMVIKEKAQE